MSHDIRIQLRIVEKSREEIASLRRQAVELADRFVVAAEEQLRKGLPVPQQLIDDYSDWQPKQTETRRLCRETLQQFGIDPPDSLDEHDLKQCEQWLETRQTELGRELDEDFYERESLLFRISVIECTSGDPAELDRLKQKTTVLKQVLYDEAAPSDAWNDITWKLIEAVWELTSSFGDSQSPAEEQAAVDRVALLQEHSLLRLAVQALQGRIRPRSGWEQQHPQRPVSIHDETTTDPMAEIATPEEVSSKSQLPGEPVLSSSEAIERLKWAQEKNDSTIGTRAVESRPTREIDVTVVEQIANRVSSTADQLERDADAIGVSPDPIHLAVLQAFEESARYVLSVVKRQPDLEMRDDSWRETLGESLQFLAHAQSAIRKLRLDRDMGTSTEQDDAFHWLKHIAETQEVFIHRHMRLDDPANPYQIHEVLPKIVAARYDWERPTRVKRLLKKIEYERTQVLGDPEGARAHWDTITGTIEELVREEDVKPSAVQLRDALIDFYEEFPDDFNLSDNVSLVFREIDRFVADREANESDNEGPSAIVSADVSALRPLIAGQKMLLIGGIPKQETRQRLEQRLGLGELEWLETREHESSSRFEALVHHPDVKLVCLLVRWSGHDHVDTIKDYCRNANKPCVLIPRGYGLNQLAHEIMSQTGDRLRESAGVGNDQTSQPGDVSDDEQSTSQPD